MSAESVSSLREQIDYWRGEAQQMEANWRHVVESLPAVEREALLSAADAMDADPDFRDPLRLKSDWLRNRANEPTP